MSNCLNYTELCCISQENISQNNSVISLLYIDFENENDNFGVES